MARIAIVTDSNSGITQAEGKKLGVYVLPMPFDIDGQPYFEDINLTQEQFYEKLTGDADVSTSQPSPDAVMSLWADLLKNKGSDEIVHIPMSSGLSGSLQSAKMLAEDYGGNVQVVDNHRISVTQRQSVLDALSLLERGYTAWAIREKLEEAAYDSVIFVGVETLEYLKRGGRVTPAGAAMGEFLNIKSLLIIEGERLDSYAKVRGSKSCKKRLLQEMKKRADEFHSRGEQIRVGVAGSFAEKADEKEWIDMAWDVFEGEDLKYDPLTFSISCHVGSGAFGMGISRKL